MLIRIYRLIWLTRDKRHSFRESLKQDEKGNSPLGGAVVDEGNAV